MKTKRLVSACAFVVLALGLFAISATSVFADDPRPQGIPFSVMPWPTARPLRVGETWSPSGSSAPVNPAPASPAVPLVILPQKPAPTPVASSIPVIVLPQNPAPVQAYVPPASNPVPMGIGTSPANALIANGSWTTLGAGSSVWYRIGNGGVHMDVFLDADPMSNVALEVFAPNQFHKPIGIGTLSKGGVQLVWAGGHWRSEGDWVAKITNNNPLSINYRLTSWVKNISNKTCYSYWEYIGSNYTYWTECQ